MPVTRTPDQARARRNRRLAIGATINALGLAVFATQLLAIQF